MHIFAKNTASKRTKSRLKEHKGNFILKRTDTPSCMNGKQSHLVFADDGWFGWLLANEVELQE